MYPSLSDVPSQNHYDSADETLQLLHVVCDTRMIQNSAPGSKWFVQDNTERTTGTKFAGTPCWYPCFSVTTAPIRLLVNPIESTRCNMRINQVSRENSQDLWVGTSFSKNRQDRPNLQVPLQKHGSWPNHTGISTDMYTNDAEHSEEHCRTKKTCFGWCSFLFEAGERLDSKENTKRMTTHAPTGWMIVFSCLIS